MKLTELTDEEFKEKVVKAYNACAEERDIYKRALEQLKGTYPNKYAGYLASDALARGRRV
jgi:hypothetical protein